MKRIVAALFLTIFLLTIVAAGSCSPSPGYNYCYTREGPVSGDRQARVTVEISNLIPEKRWAGTFPVGDKNYAYGVGGIHINYKFSSADNFYVFKVLATEIKDNDYCTEGGCSGGESVSERGRYDVVNTGESFSGPITFIGHDYDSYQGYWSWVWGGTGFNPFEYRAVECYDNSDCSSGQICDKSGEWKDWYCKVKECDAGQTKCEGFNSYTCENNQWKNKGAVLNKCNVECMPQTEKCNEKELSVCSSNYSYVNNSNVIGKCGVECFTDTSSCFGLEYRTCSSNLTWDNLGKVKDKCEVSCLSNADCTQEQPFGAFFCMGDSVGQKFVKYKCNEINLCDITDEVVSKEVQKCEDICLNGLCDSKVVIKGEPNPFAKYGISMIIILFAIALFFVFGRKK